MDNLEVKMQTENEGAMVLIHDLHQEIALDSLQLLKLDFRQANTRILCTAGTLWLTQSNDLHDHLLKTGQSLTLYGQGMILVQSLPYGKARVLNAGDEIQYHGEECAGFQKYSLKGG